MLPRPRFQEELAYHPPVLKKVVSPAEKVLQAVFVAVVGTGLGIGVGVFLAGRTFPADTLQSAAPAPAANQTPAGGPATASRTTTAQTTTVKTGAQPGSGVSNVAGASATTQTTAGNKNSDTKPSPVAQTTTIKQIIRPRLVSATLTGRRIGVRHRHGLRRRTALARIALPKVQTPAPIEEARLEIPDERFRFTIEGDQTAVAYDAQAGVVSTEGAGLFLIEKPQDATPLVRSQQIPSNLHYKCDQDANCSLIMASLVVPHARMQTANQAGDLAYVPISTNGLSRDTLQTPLHLGSISR
jgi:hypothetical protein